MDLGIKGKWALVCGASKGLGLGCARSLAREGVNVVIVARGAEVLQAAAESLRASGVQVIAVAADITTVAGREAVWSVAGGPGKNYDIVVTNAGGPPPGDFRDWDREAWIKAVDGNMLTPIELIKATVDGMAERGFGRIVNITSSAVKSPVDGLGLSTGARSGGCGFVAGLALVQDKASRQPFAPELAVGMICRKHCFDNGLVMRAVGDRMIVAPPLIMDRAQIDQMIVLIRLALDRTLAELRERGIAIQD